MIKSPSKVAALSTPYQTMAPNSYPGQPSSTTRPPPKRLLDLPDDILLQILYFLVPPPGSHLTDDYFIPQDANIGLTCSRLYRLIKPRLQTLDFVYPTSTTQISRVPEKVSNNIEAFVRMSYPYVETLRLPTDFWPEENVVTLLQTCTHLRELSFSMNTDVTKEQVQNFFIRLKNLNILTVHYPRTEFLNVLASAKPSLTDLTLVNLHSCTTTRQYLENILESITSLQSLALSFYEGTPRRSNNRRYVGKRSHVRERQGLYATAENISACSQMLCRHHTTLTSLRKLSLLMRRPDLCSKRYDYGLSMAETITCFSDLINQPREHSFSSPPDLKITSFCLKPYDWKSLSFSCFNGLIDASTEVLVHFSDITVEFPAVIDKDSPPKPVVKAVNVGDRRVQTYDFASLMTCAELGLESLTFTNKESANWALETEKLPLLLHGNNLKSIALHYVVETVEDVKMTVQLLRAVTLLAPCVSQITLPSYMVNKSDALTVDDLKNISCAEKLRVLGLHNTVPSTFRRYHEFLYEELHFRILGSENGRILEVFLMRLPRFLDIVRQAFPGLSELRLTPMSVKVGSIYIDNFMLGPLLGMVDIIRRFEEESGIDASSLRMVLSALVRKVTEMLP